MSQAVHTLWKVYCIALTVLLGYLAYIAIREYQRPLPHEQYQTAPKNKITVAPSEFLKTSQTDEAPFTLSAPRKVSHKELICLARNIYHEARGESLPGMMGIAQITLNRADSQHRGKQTLCSVVHDPSQFSWTRKAPNKPLDKKAWQQSLYVAQLVLLGVRIKGLEESLYFHSKKIRHPKWGKEFGVNKIIGNHIYLGIIRG